MQQKGIRLGLAYKATRSELLGHPRWLCTPGSTLVRLQAEGYKAAPLAPAGTLLPGVGWLCTPASHNTAWAAGPRPSIGGGPAGLRLTARQRDAVSALP